MRSAKKAVCFILCLIMLFSLCACGLNDYLLEDTLAELKYSFNSEYDPRSYITSFDGIKYRHPSLKPIRELAEDIEDNADNYFRLTDNLKKLDEFFGLYYNFCTMKELACIHSDANTDSEYWLREYSYCSESFSELTAIFDELLLACSNSVLSSLYDKYYFGGLLKSDYSADDGYTPSEELTGLLRREAELENEYTGLFVELSSDSSDYPHPEYYDKIAGLYIDLIKVRRDIAQLMNYDSYEELAYAQYGRDYSPEDTGEYVKAVKTCLVPLFSEYCKKDFNLRGYGRADVKESFSAVTDTLYGLDDGIDEALDFMLDYGLYDISSRSFKNSTSYVTYLYSFDAPFLFVCPSGYDDDVLSIAHELGHFTERYLNCDCNDSIDSSELFSQGVEYLLLSRLGGRRADVLTKYKLVDTLSLYTEQMSYNEFEQRAFEMDVDKLSPESLCELFEEIVEEYGYTGQCGSEPGMEWIDIQHLFIYPFYVISYCVSDTAAFSLYEKELAKSGSGFDLYIQMINDAVDCDFLELSENAGLTSPLSADSIRLLSDTLRAKLGL